jgi:hypothetical protein
LEDYLMITTESNYQHFFAKNFHLSSSGSWNYKIFRFCLWFRKSSSMGSLGYKCSPYIYPKDEAPEFSSIVVRTVDNLLIEYLIGLWSQGEKPCLLLGE